MASRARPYWYRIEGNDGSPLNARFAPQGAEVVFASGGGGGRNTDYLAGLELLLRRLQESSVPITGAWVDSERVQGLELRERQILDSREAMGSPEQIRDLLTKRMRTIGRDPGAKATGGNQRKQLRIALQYSDSHSRLVSLLKGIESAAERLPGELLNKVTPEFVWEAVQQLSDTRDWAPFCESSDFDLVTASGERLPPKAVFARALSLALNGMPIEPKHFSSGVGSPCFRLLEAADFSIVGKNEVETSQLDDEGDEFSGREWAEGKPRLQAHRKRERGHGLAKAKKSQFRRLHGGMLFCEVCGMSPVQEYGDDLAESCIEVHHAATQVRDMSEGHRTRLSDLQCVCANCHRLIHRRLGAGVAASTPVHRTRAPTTHPG